ncbi:aminopeptidase N-like [Ptychodera flava]|uniref:aminopeptidase N-like n=1 Tax=Ptychodera flava TaxID=63121 RepID=UPI00396A843B
MARSQPKQTIYVSTSAGALAVLVAAALVSGSGLLAYFLRPQGCEASAVTDGPKLTALPSPLPSTTSPEEPWESHRLPDTLKPLLYNLKIKIDLDEFLISGRSEITFTCTAATRYVILHTKLQEIDKESIKVCRQTDGEILEQSAPSRLYPQTQYLVIELSTSLTEDVDYVVVVEYTGVLEDDLIGIYRSSYIDDDGNRRYLAASFFSPANARKAFPCFDEPAMKANISTTLVHRPEYVALSNMPSSSKTDDGAGWVETTFEQTPTMSTYVVGFFVSDFTSVTNTSRDRVEIRIWARHNAIEQVQYAMEIALPILEYYEDYFGINFPLPKIDMAATPDYGAGGMENWGLINYRESAFLYDPQKTTAVTKRRVATVVSHELAHQWFGNLATHWWWEDLWLKEGFASFMEYYGVDLVEPSWKILDQFLILDLHTALSLDALLSSHPISVPVNQVDEINSIFDAISYNKGASVIRMLRYFLGESTFRNGLKKYLNRFAYSNAKMNDLWDALTEATNEDGLELPASIKDIMNTWTLQMGYPVVTVTRDYSRPDVITFSCAQEQFLIDPSALAPDDTTWYVPLTFTDGSDPKYVEGNFNQIWLERGSVTMDDESALRGGNDDWLLTNINQTGYFVVNYDDRNWELIKRQLLDEHEVIPSACRAALLNDAFSLARGEHLPTTAALELSRYLRQERDYVPWVAASRAFDYMESMLRTTGSYGAYQEFVLDLVTTFYERLGWNDSHSENVESLSRSLALNIACNNGHQGCIQEAVRLFDEWMADTENNRISPNVRDVVYCTAIGQGDRQHWEFAWQQYKATQVSSEKLLLMNAMTCSKEPWILSRYLKLCLQSDEIRRQDATSVIGDIAANIVGESLAWDYFRANWDYFFATYGTNMFSFPDLINGVTGAFSTELRLRELEDFMGNNPNLGTGAKAFNQAVERTKANIRWKQTNVDGIQVWLERRGAS